jgi:hypothetical protein
VLTLNVDIMVPGTSFTPPITNQITAITGMAGFTPSTIPGATVVRATAASAGLMTLGVTPADGANQTIWSFSNLPSGVTGDVTAGTLDITAAAAAAAGRATITATRTGGGTLIWDFVWGGATLPAGFDAAVGVAQDLLDLQTDATGLNTGDDYLPDGAPRAALLALMTGTTAGTHVMPTLNDPAATQAQIDAIWTSATVGTLALAITAAQGALEQAP